MNTSSATILDNDVDEYQILCRNDDTIDQRVLDCTATTDCVGILECREVCRSCAILPLDAGGPWGDVLDVVISILPIVFLIVVTVSSSSWPTSTSLPVSAVVLAFLRMAYFGHDPVLILGSIVLGIHEALTPLSIMAGAIGLFETMEATRCMPYLMREIKVLTNGHAVAELLLIFAFCTMVEGASGFGTPVALAAPMLVSTGHPAKESIIVLLLFNTFATVWGAVGTPLWFGFGLLIDEDDDDDFLLQISRKAALSIAIASYLLLPYILTFLVPFKVVRRNWLFAVTSISATILPTVGIATISYEFPSLIGGMVGCMLNVLLIRFKIGLVPCNKPMNDDDAIQANNDSRPKSLNEDDSVESETDNKIVPAEELSETIMNPTNSVQEPLDDCLQLGPRIAVTDKGKYFKELICRTFAIWFVVLLLILTRIGQIGIKPYLTQQNPALEVTLGSYGVFRLSASGVFQLEHIATFPGLNWKYELLYVPFLIPFVLSSLLTIAIFRDNMTCTTADIANTVVSRLSKPAVALAGSLVLVQLMIRTSTSAPAFILGSVLSDWFQKGFIVVCPLLGALGSFFSGSTTVSNLTFGAIQRIAASSVGTSETAMLALQVVGASAGNGICLNNIIAACAVVGLNIGEGKILTKTCVVVFMHTSIATLVLLGFFF